MYVDLEEQWSKIYIHLKMLNETWLFNQQIMIEAKK